MPITYKPEGMRKLREVANVSQTDAARATGLSQSQISAFESGRYAPPLISFISLAKFYRVPIAEAVEAITEDSEEVPAA